MALATISPCLVLVHPFDPRGPKVGGIETHVRQLIDKCPADMRLLMVGVDDAGDLRPGRVHRISAGGRSFDFYPVAHIPGSAGKKAATRLSDSVTLQFALGLARHVPALRRLLRGQAAVAEIERLEFAAMVRALGLPFVFISHNEGDPRTDKMDSLLSRFWYVNSLAEGLAVRLADRAFGVTARIRDRLAGHARAPDKCGVLTVSVDTDLFRPSPFILTDAVLRLVYAGRLDEFKAPETMFATVRHVADLLGGQVEFHYCGNGDPTGFASFAPIAPITRRHGALPPGGVASVMQASHIGILLSHYEGMPCFLLELLASGRPYGGIRLPQFEPVVRKGVSGAMVDRAATEEETARIAAVAIVELWDDIRAGALDPALIHTQILPWSTDSQLQRLFDTHRKIARSGRSPDF